MDVRPESFGPTEADDHRGPIDQAELRSILSGLGQELCKPLNSLRAGFDLLLGETSRPVSQDQRGHVRTMASLCDDLLRITQGYLDYAVLVQGAKPLALGVYTVGVLIREVDRQFSAAAEGRGIEWECRLEGGDAAVTTDASKCQQVFAALAANALKYTPAGGSVRVTGRVEGPAWVVSVADTGPGVPETELDRIFAPFYRLARDERTRAEGDGLGLAVCRALVGQLGGSIMVESRVGAGSRFSVRLPVDDPAGRGKG